MCGIVACYRDRDALPFLLNGLQALEYRGYDSAGIALTNGFGGLSVVKSRGRVSELERRCQAIPVLSVPVPRASGGAQIGVGHTRWATHGAPSETNAHPHVDCSGRLAVVHNGIIENAGTVRNELMKQGHVFNSDVDSEVVPHLLEDMRRGDLSIREALLRIGEHLSGQWALAVLDADSEALFATAHRSPLVLGRSHDGVHLASDVGALAGWVDTVHVLEDGDVVEITDRPRWWDATGASRVEPEPVVVPLDRDVASLAGHADFMAKEIAEQPQLAVRIVGRMLPGLDGSLWHETGLRIPRRICFVGCGTSLNAAYAIGQVFAREAGIPVEMLTASEVTDHLTDAECLTIAVSQSGETADVLAALQHVDGPLLAITNNVYSTLARRADHVERCDAGIEIGVAATKTFTTQVLVGSALALSLSAIKTGFTLRHRRMIRAFAESPNRLEESHFLSAPLADAIAADLAEESGFLFISRAEGLPYAREGALKLKEISYRWAETYPAGELKHGPIALVDRGTPVIVVEGGEPAKLMSNVSEVEARGGRVLRVASDDCATFPVVASENRAPWGPLESVIPLQHLARALALVRGLDADKPRNLAKSVTVE